ncbi:hypothetical protein ACS5PK_20695 [Roseateles sp. DB2]|uniref:hypothetical protein n=1 Tax=Roseateles sp. DB2 TaxID=3453717 RepID=UPI003EE9C705
MPAGFMRPARWVCALWLCALWVCAQPALADPGYYVLTPYAQAGQWGAELRYWTVKPRRGGPAVLWPELALSYGVGERWTSTLLASFEGTRKEAVRLATWNWINQFRLGDGGGDWDFALHTQAIRTQGEEHGHALELGLVSQTEWRLARLQANVILEHGWGDLARSGTELKYQWQVNWPLRPGWRAGLQGFGEVGNWRDWKPAERQSHRAGPSLLGSWPMGGHQDLQLQAAYLFGKVYGQQAGMFSATLKLLF